VVSYGALMLLFTLIKAYDGSTHDVAFVWWIYIFFLANLNCLYATMVLNIHVFNCL